MTAEQFLWAWLKSEILNPKELIFIPENIYYGAMNNTIAQIEREEYKRND